MLVAGVDGCRDGWIFLIGDSIGERISFLDVLIVQSFKELIAATQSCAAVAVDIPIGLSEDRPRRADLEARKRLGRPRASSVFPAPVRAVLACEDYRAACDVSAWAWGRRLSKQSFNILPKIREADSVLTASDQRRIVEAHPEVCFTALNAGRPMVHYKKTADGVEERRALLHGVYVEDVSLRPVPKGAGRDDFHDACVLVWTASRLARGRAERLPSEPELDSRGLRMEIVY